MDSFLSVPVYGGIHSSQKSFLIDSDFTLDREQLVLEDKIRLDLGESPRNTDCISGIFTAILK